MAPLIAIIIAGNIANRIKHSDHYNEVGYAHKFYSQQLKIVGQVTQGTDFLQSPSLKWSFGKLIGDVFPVALIAFMESYSVAHRLATRRNELHLLNASQEMFANGMANFMASISSAYPISGSYSRSSLNAASGATTPLSKMVTLFVIVAVLESLTTTFQYIPYAVLSAIVWVAIWNLLSFSEFWEAWKSSKVDFLVMVVTFVVVFVFNTEYGLAVGLGLSLVVFVTQIYMQKSNSPQLVSCSQDNAGVDVITLHSDLTFITIGQYSDLFDSLIQIKEEYDEEGSFAIRTRHNIETTLDRYLGPKRPKGVIILPTVIVLDLHETKVKQISFVL
jgi:MFS superfamily sulfate permease-like transporter